MNAYSGRWAAGHFFQSVTLCMNWALLMVISLFAGQPVVGVKVAVVLPHFEMEFVGVGGGVFRNSADVLFGRHFGAFLHADGGEILIDGDVFAVADHHPLVLISILNARAKSRLTSVTSP